MYTVLCISCHPDDMEVYCAGTLLKCKARGDRVVVCHLSSGNKGHVIIPPDELSVMRAEEAAQSAFLGGIDEVIWGGFDDLEIFDNNKAARDKVVEIIKRVDPDFIITHPPEDYMPDHVATSKLVFDAAFAATLPNYHVSTAGHAKMVPIYYVDPPAGVGFDPTEYVDITPYIDKKLEMLNCHASQIVWMREHDNVDFPLMVKTFARYRGYQCGADYAEGFKQCHVYLKGTTKRYLP
ncbi:MAG: PIG-L family deacetylase [Clostridia bacterium]|nr:PIG-L family deacetylase [Clostridia bacterium]